MTETRVARVTVSVSWLQFPLWVIGEPPVRVRRRGLRSPPVRHPHHGLASSSEQRPWIRAVDSPAAESPMRQRSVDGVSEPEPGERKPPIGGVRVRAEVGLIESRRMRNQCSPSKCMRFHCPRDWRPGHRHETAGRDHPAIESRSPRSAVNPERAEANGEPHLHELEPAGRVAEGLWPSWFLSL